jgi:hypothetical protein
VQRNLLSSVQLQPPSTKGYPHTLRVVQSMSICPSWTMRPLALRPRSFRSYLSDRSSSTPDQAYGGQAFFAYSTNYLINVENAIIVDVDRVCYRRPCEIVVAN